MRIVDKSGKISIQSDFYDIFIHESANGGYTGVYARRSGKESFDLDTDVTLAIYSDYDKALRLFDAITHDESVGVKVCDISKKGM